MFILSVFTRFDIFVKQIYQKSTILEVFVRMLFFIKRVSISSFLFFLSFDFMFNISHAWFLFTDKNLNCTKARFIYELLELALQSFPLLIWSVYVVIGLCKIKNKNSESEKVGISRIISNEEESGHCNICLEDYKKGETLIKLKCFAEHEFHKKCLNEWIVVNRSCPLCRMSLN
ncbi:hypothetical protein MHBO_001203 [Bonamia ostreae]|uniref:RING-type domain-containing protein n=1 Tax=Bonamia ostreae TaxID=126728 RepID=A0ABV2AI40_9EUKA